MTEDHRDDEQPSDPESPDLINHPSHYNQGKYEVIDVIDDWKLNFYEAQVVKYVARSRHKGNQLEDIRKALWYLTRYEARIAELEVLDHVG